MSSRGNVAVATTGAALGSFSLPGTRAKNSAETIDRLMAVPGNDFTGGANAARSAAAGLATRLAGNSDFEGFAAANGKTTEGMVFDILRSWYTLRALGYVGASQLAARDVFHLSDASQSSSKVPAKAESLYSTYRGAFQALVRAQYDATQAMFARAGVTHLTLYRGLGMNDQSNIPKNTNYDGLAHQMDVTMRPLTSFTTSRVLAEGYARTQAGDSMLMAVDVPVSHILSTPMSGFGIQDQQEVVVLGGKQSVSYRAYKG